MAQKKNDQDESVETLEYIQAMLGQLGSMARTNHFNMLTYLIELAYVEAGDIFKNHPSYPESAVASPAFHDEGNHST